MVRVNGIICYLENYIGTDDWQCSYNRGRCYYEYVCRIKQGKENTCLMGN